MSDAALDPDAGAVVVAGAEPPPLARVEPVVPGPWYRAEAATGMERLFLALFAFGGAAVLTVAILLKPAVAGHGTHQSMGLPPCSFLTITGLPCLSCGMTTSFAHTVRGEISSALAAQPFGAFLAMMTMLCVPLFLAAALSGRSVSGPAGRLPWNKIGPVLLVGLFAAWGYKILVMRGAIG